MTLQSREVTGDTTLSATTDDVIIYNDLTGGTWTVSLPAGSNGLTYFITPASTNTGLFTLVPNGSDILDPVNIFSYGTITYSDGVWYLCI